MKIILTIILLVFLWFSVAFFLGGCYAVDYVKYEKAIAFAPYDNDIVEMFTQRTFQLLNMKIPDELRLRMLAKLLNENERIAGNNLRPNINLVSLYLMVGDRERAQKQLNKIIFLSPGRIDDYKKIYE